MPGTEVPNQEVQERKLRVPGTGEGPDAAREEVPDQEVDQEDRPVRPLVRVSTKTVIE